MLHRLHNLILCTLLTSSCGSELPEPETAPSTDKSNLEIAQRIYADQRLPPDFYVEPQRDSSVFYVIQHIKATQIFQTPPALDYELCSDDFAQALQWSQHHNGQHSMAGALTDSTANDMYYEFNRTLQNNRARLERVFKCAYLDRSGLDTTAGEYAGSLNTLPIQSPYVGAVAEYLWTFSGYNNVGNVVLESRGQEGPDAITHTISIARKLDGAGLDGCDYIELIDWIHEAITLTGVLKSTEQVVGGFSAEQLNGVVRVCE